MAYEAPYRIGYNPAIPRAEAKAVAPPVKRLRGLDGADKGRKRNPKGQTAVRTDGHAANGFLRTSFLPRLHETETVQACGDPAKTERDFYQSLSHLAKHYGIQPMQTRSYGYPYNIALAMWDTGEHLRGRVRDWEGIKLVQDRGKTYLTSEERYNTGSTLYYIPVMPLYRMLRDPERKHTAQLLLSVFSYLYHVAEVPYYRHECSFLYWQYEMLEEWVLCDDHDDDTPTYLSELGQAKWIGEHMGQKIYNYHNIDRFRERLDHFKGRDTFDNDCWLLAGKAFAIFGDYPIGSVFRNARPNGGAKEDDTDNVIAMEKYVSFCADSRGWLNDNLEDAVNANLQEYGQVEEPAVVKRFDGSDLSGKGLHFENRLFPMMDELIGLLDNYQTEAE